MAETTTSASSSSAPIAVELDRPRAEPLRQLLAVRQRPVRDNGDVGPARDEVPRRRLAHLAGAEHEHPPSGEIVEDLLRERGGRRRHRRGALADRRLEPDPAAGVQRLPEELVEERPGRARLERRPHLAEDLALARNERVEPCGDAEEVQRRRLVAEPVERGGEVGAAVAGELGECRDRELLRVLVLDEVELGAVAGGENDRFALEPFGERPAGLEVERDALAQLDRSLVMRHACERQLHAAKWVRGRTIATSAKPARLSSAARPPAPAFVPQHEQRGVRGEDQQRDGHRRVEVAALEAGCADADPERQHDERAEHRPGCEPVERVERRHPDAQDAAFVALQPSLLPEVHRRHARGQRQPGEAGQHQDGVDCEHDAGAVALVERGPASRPGQREQRGRDRHHGQPEQPVAGRAAPDQVGADDEPDEEIERTGPGPPREPFGRDALADEERRLRQPAEPDAPRREPAGEPRPSQLARVGERGFPVGEQRRDDEELSHCS